MWATGSEQESQCLFKNKGRETSHRVPEQPSGANGSPLGRTGPASEPLPQLRASLELRPVGSHTALIHSTWQQANVCKIANWPPVTSNPPLPIATLVHTASCRCSRVKTGCSSWCPLPPRSACPQAVGQCASCLTQGQKPPE